MIADDIYSLEELKELSDRKQVKKIVEWLTATGIPYISTPSGIPRVHRAALATRMGVATESANESEDGPDMSKVR